jgi:hypothetical protein
MYNGNVELFSIYMYELAKGCGIQNDLNGLLDSLLEE